MELGKINNTAAVNHTDNTLQSTEKTETKPEMKKNGKKKLALALAATAAIAAGCVAVKKGKMTPKQLKSNVSGAADDAANAAKDTIKSGADSLANVAKDAMKSGADDFDLDAIGNVDSIRAYVDRLEKSARGRHKAEILAHCEVLRAGCDSVEKGRDAIKNLESALEHEEHRASIMADIDKKIVEINSMLPEVMAKLGIQ